jgi:mRNA-degrading endonuclease toxin of MazEF toxin-antitoxin module
MRRGEIWHVDLDPTKGHEQNGKRWVLIVSPDAFNKLMGVPLVVPITTGGNFARVAGFTVNLTGAGTKTHGVALCHQVRALDLRAHGGRRAEMAPDWLIEEVLAILGPLFK